MSSISGPAKSVADVAAVLAAADPMTMNAATAQMALLSDSPLKAHRVQISVRGRRFETSMEVATTYGLAFYLFFGLPLNTTALRATLAADASLSNTASQAFHAWMDQCDNTTQSGGVYVSDVVQAGFVPALSAVSDNEDTAEASLLSMVLRNHFTATVVPALIALEASLIDSVPPSEATPVSTPALPPLPLPDLIEFDQASQQWRFNYPKRLASEAEERERARLQRLAVLAQQSLAGSASGNPAAAAAAGGLDPSGNPFLLLQPDYLGVLLVYLRRVEKARLNPATTTRQPEFPVRWHELGYDEQVSLTQLLRALGVVPLLLTPLARPSADPEVSSVYCSSHPERVVAQGAMEDAAAGGSLRARAEQFLQETGQAGGEVPVDASAYVHPSVADDLLVLPSQGCSKCGMSGHPTADCPH